MKRKTIFLSIALALVAAFSVIKVSDALVYSFKLNRFYANAVDVCFYLQLESQTPLGTCTISDVDFGDATTQFDITKPYVTNSNVCRYTYDSTGTDPEITYDMPGTGAIVVANAQNFSAGNNGYYITTTAVADYFEVTNTSCVAEDDKTIGTGDIGYRIDEPAFGGATTQFDITNPSGNVCRYTWDETGTDPGINRFTFKIGYRLSINADNFSAGNNGFYDVTASGFQYFEVTNTGCVAETDKTIGATGYLKNRG